VGNGKLIKNLVTYEGKFGENFIEIGEIKVTQPDGTVSYEKHPDNLDWYYN